MSKFKAALGLVWTILIVWLAFEMGRQHELNTYLKDFRAPRAVAPSRTLFSVECSDGDPVGNTLIWKLTKGKLLVDWDTPLTLTHGEIQGQHQRSLEVR